MSYENITGDVGSRLEDISSDENENENKLEFGTGCGIKIKKKSLFSNT